MLNTFKIMNKAKETKMELIKFKVVKVRIAYI